MADIIVSKKNETSLYIDCELGILYELQEKFSFFVEGYKFMPKFKAKMWDGTVKLLDVRFGTLPVGLYNELVTHSTSLGYTVECKSNQYGALNDKDDATYDDIEKYINGLNIHSKNQKVEIREYQIKAIFNCIKNQRQISVTPTGGGKSLIAYCLYRWYIDHGKSHFMLVVPNLGLIKQMYNDFKDYSSHNNFDVEKETQIIAEGADKTITKSLIICTWQSVFKQQSKWFNQLDVILADEAHQYKAEAVKGIFEKAVEVKYRFGITGSLDKSTTNKMVLRGLIGEISQEKTTRDLIDEGFLSDININCILLKYGKESKKLVSPMEYHEELNFICTHTARNKFIRKLALSLKGNTLILFNFISHGEELYADIKKNAINQECYLVCGKVEADEREEIRNLIQNATTDTIALGSYGTCSTGINIPKIHNIIFASPSKSVIRIMQSVGRGLRKADGKNILKLYDISDAINTSKTSPNFAFSHFTERLRIYVSEKHHYKIIEVKIE